MKGSPAASKPGKSGKEASPAPPAAASSGGDLWTRFKGLLARPVNGASLALFRIGLGLVMALEAYSLCRPNPSAITMGSSPVRTYYAGPDITFNLPYEGFEWIPLLSPTIIYVIICLQALGAVMVAVGLFYRVAAVTMFLACGYLFGVESTRTYWQSHYYLEFLAAFLMVWMPAARRYSLDAWLARGKSFERTVPFWTVLLLRGQLVIAYFYAGVAKLTKDWILDAVPVRWFLREPHVTAPYERFLSATQIEKFKALLHSPELAYFLSYAGLAFDLAVGFLLLFRRTRVFALGCMLIFHAINHFLIFDDIGWFPLLGIATALIFLEPDWPERFWEWLKHPKVPRPNWTWLIGGAIALPGLGALLGWKSKPARAVPAAETRGLAFWVMALFVGWLTLQALVPLRHFFIPGDGRFTYEGMSFSWRLKSEVRHSYIHQLFIKDSAVLSATPANGTRIDWSQWKGEKVFYRRVVPGQIDWRALPEITVLLEPMVGERLIYNPLAANIQNETVARERVKEIWLQTYGRAPSPVLRPTPLWKVLESLAKALQDGGEAGESRNVANMASAARQLENPVLGRAERSSLLRRLSAGLKRIHSRDAEGGMTRYLRRLPPGLLEGEAESNAPFLIIEDKPLLEGRGFRVSREGWKGSDFSRARTSSIEHAGADPLVVHLTSLGPESKNVLPQAYIGDSMSEQKAPTIWWNSARDLSYSKLLHASNQAFYLRRYARRVASLWEKEYGRRPAISAFTSMSLNGRPHQPLVDPEADLASVSSKWFGHNAWIRDLETPRIPREALSRGWEPN